MRSPPSSPVLALAPDRSTGAIVSRFAPVAEAASGLKRNVLACVRTGRPAALGDDPRDIPLPLAPVGSPLPDGSPAVELWTSDRPVDFDRAQGFNFATNGEVLFGHIYVLEIELDAVAAAIFRTYARLTAFLEQVGYGRLLRCWNFLNEINGGIGDRERYRQFCVGRYQALAGRAGFERALPAATAIGMHEPGFLLYFFAAREPGVQVENPRQVPAFEYPRQYGPRSPSFSRATFARCGDSEQLLVSGTASVVGHVTRHPHDPAAQLTETIANLEALIAHASEKHLGDGRVWVPETLRMFVRDAADAAALRPQLDKAFGRNAPLQVLEGDICRDDLRVEIDARYRAAPPPARGPA
jgi:chorismate lyase / 3-hydroxybenzoate synthase